MALQEIKKKLKIFLNIFMINKNKKTFVPEYRVIEILQENEEDYIAKIQVIDRNMTFNIRPEEILAQDEMVNRFSPCDVRALTYLGYLGINSPKYKILAKRLSEKDQKFIFALKKKGDIALVTKTADEIIKEKDVLASLNSEDAHMVGYALAMEVAKAEKIQKEQAIKQFQKEKIE